MFRSKDVVLLQMEVDASLPAQTAAATLMGVATEWTAHPPEAGIVCAMVYVPGGVAPALKEPVVGFKVGMIGLAVNWPGSELVTTGVTTDPLVQNCVTA